MLTARKRVGPLPARRLASRHASPHSPDHYSSSSSSSSDSSPVHSLGLDAEAFRRWCATPLSTWYPPTTSESSIGDSSERPMHLSSHSAGPSRKRCRSPVDSAQGHYRKDCPKIKNQNRGNKASVPDARGRAYALGGGDVNPGSNTVTGTFLLNDHHAYMLFDSGADRSLVSNTFSALLEITPSALDVNYAVELADERTSEINTVLGV
ncbi:hypothetical protein Tco_0120490 [Tanacetum coccineum]